MTASKPQVKIDNLSLLAYAQGFTLWHYRAGQDCTLADTLAPDFFAAFAGMFAAGEVVMISASDGGAQAFVAEVAPRVTLRIMSRTKA